MISASGDSLIIPAVPDLIWGSVSFIVVAIAVYRFAWPAFTRMLDERTQKIDEGLHAAERAKEEVARERAALADEVDEARREAAQIREKAQANAVSIVDDAKKNAAVEAQRVTEAAQRQIAADTQLARAQLRQDVGALATDLAGRIVGQHALSPHVSASVVDQFLDELEDEAATSAGGRAGGEG